MLNYNNNFKNSKVHQTLHINSYIPFKCEILKEIYYVKKGDKIKLKLENLFDKNNFSFNIKKFPKKIGKIIADSKILYKKKKIYNYDKDKNNIYFIAQNIGKDTFDIYGQLNKENNYTKSKNVCSIKIIVYNNQCEICEKLFKKDIINFIYCFNNFLINNKADFSDYERKKFFYNLIINYNKIFYCKIFKKLYKNSSLFFNYLENYNKNNNLSVDISSIFYSNIFSSKDTINLLKLKEFYDFNINDRINRLHRLQPNYIQKLIRDFISDLNNKKIYNFNFNRISFFNSSLYLSPEIIFNNFDKYSNKEKIISWSIGIILYRMYFDNLPFTDIYQIYDYKNKLFKLNLNKTNPIENVIYKLLHPNYKKRMSLNKFIKSKYFNEKNNETLTIKNYIYYKQLLNRGFYGEIVKGYDLKNSNSTIVIKITNLLKFSGLFGVYKNIKIFVNVKKEINYMRKLQKKTNNTVFILDNFLKFPYIYMILEYCDTTLENLIRENRGLSNKLIQKIFLQLNNAIKALNEEKIIHYDLKPDNILIKYTNNSDFIVKLTDYGCSTKRFNPLPRNRPYIALDKYGSIKSDLWSLGVIIYECYFYEFPFEDKIYTNLKIKKTNDIYLDDLIEKLLKEDVNERINIEDYLNHKFFSINYNKSNIIKLI